MLFGRFDNWIKRNLMPNELDAGLDAGLDARLDAG